MEQGLRIVAVGAFVLAAGCSSTTTTTVVAPTSTTPTPTSPGPTAIQHTDLVASAEAVGEQCDSPNPQGVTSCGDITFVDGDPELAKRFYDSRCFPTDQTGADLGAWVWYEEGDWEFELASTTITPEAVRVISDKLGADARDCRRNLG
jgi:hypothetical protein